jgi:hypothetical protein
MPQFFSTQFPRLAKSCLVAVVCAIAPSIAFAADSKPSETPIKKFALYPAPAPVVALQYPLLPRYLERTAGNAAPLYLKAMLLMADKRQANEFWEKIDRWMASPPAELPQAEVRAALEQFHYAMSYAKMAAHRDRCDWDAPLRESEHPYEILLPEMQDMRSIGRIVALQARLQIAEGHPADALATLQTGFAMAKHASQYSFLISDLVGQAVANLMTEQLETLIQTKNCPNLYWNLTELPQPLIDFRPDLDVESASVYQEFPQLRDVEHTQRTAEEWQAQLGAFLKHWNDVTASMTFISSLNGENEGTSKQVASALGKVASLITAYPKAKAGLIAAGRDRARVEAMPPAQVILAYTALCLDRSRDGLFKWFGLPYWQARDGIAAAQRNFRTEAEDESVFSIASQLVPAIGKIRESQARAERRMAALRIVESIRMYAASHDGKLPARLDDLTEAPAPLDPVSGKPFAYKVTDGKALLEGLPPVNEDSLHYEITIATIKK